MQAQQTSVLQTRKGTRRLARSVIAPSSGEMMKIAPIEIAVTRPYTRSAFSAPTADHVEREHSDTTPIEKMVFARS